MANDSNDDEPQLRPVFELAPKALKPSARQRRLLELPLPNADDPILYQHSVLCQTCLPYRALGRRANG